MSSATLEFVNSYRTIGIEDADGEIQSLQTDINHIQQVRKSRIAAGRVVTTLPADICSIIFTFIRRFFRSVRTYGGSLVHYDAWTSVGKRGADQTFFR
ncbi:hypothetical protein ONZ45_g19354 [Pleurotus djamor]|nr:hypothetical protein ONZ45_g19354 [Pleurotus djamor]